MNAPVRAVATPCIGVCMLDEAGVCMGCLRTLDEIAGWMDMSDAQRSELMEAVLPMREAQRS